MLSRAGCPRRQMNLMQPTRDQRRLRKSKFLLCGSQGRTLAFPSLHIWTKTMTLLALSLELARFGARTYIIISPGSQTFRLNLKLHIGSAEFPACRLQIEHLSLCESVSYNKSLHVCVQLVPFLLRIPTTEFK